MVINAYSEDYVDKVQFNLGHMFDFAVNTLDYDIDRFCEMYVASGVAGQIENGNPTYLVGKTGCELAKEVLKQAGKPTEQEDEMYLDKSPEFWTGWVLAYYQWRCAMSFSKIQKAVPASIIVCMYPTLHEADISKFVSVMDEKIKGYYKDTNLKRIRKCIGYSQKRLAEESGVSLRQIQLLEQRQRDINKTHLDTVIKLSKALSCTAEDLVELLR
jgi:DNA-binding Xre family transcriptional regulator